MNEKKATLLVVDDVPGNIKALVSFLAKAYDIRIAKSGPAALETASSMPIDLILLDIVMPDMDGYEVLGRLKAHEATRDIPVIFLSGMDDAAQQAKGFEMGAVDFIVKPAQGVIVNRRVETQLLVQHHKRIIEQQVQARTAELEAKVRELEEKLSHA
ncbi:MAG: response regulator [Magnetococcales bacterium]|nr:response regulator [Magnetococcales bacterium]